MSDDPEDGVPDPRADVPDESDAGDGGAGRPGSAGSGEGDAGDGGDDADGAEAADGEASGDDGSGVENADDEAPGAAGSSNWPEDWVGGEADRYGADTTSDDEGDPDPDSPDSADPDRVGEGTGESGATETGESGAAGPDDHGSGDPTAGDPPDEPPGADPAGRTTNGEGPSDGADVSESEPAEGDPGEGEAGGLTEVDPGGGLSSLQESHPETADSPTGPDGVPVLAPVEYGPKPAPSSSSTASEDDADDADDEGGLRKVETDRSDEQQRHRPDTSGPDQTDEQPPRPGEDRPEPDDRASPGSDRDGPPPGHAIGAPDPGEIESPEDVGSPEEGVPDPVADPEIEVGPGGGAADETPGGGAVPEPDPGGGPTEADFGPPSDDPTAPPDDEEMPLTVHIEEMIGRVGVVFVAVAVATAIAFLWAEGILLEMWYDTLPIDPAAAADPTQPSDDRLRPHIYSPLEKILAEIKVASLAGILVALPVLVYQAYRFMRPGLYPRERRYFLAAVPTSLVLGAVGMLFAYFLVLPLMFDYFVVYSEAGVDKLAFSLRVTVDLIVAMLGAFAVVFQIPLLIMLAIMMGVTSRRWLESRRIYFWAGFLGLGFLLGLGDPTGLAPFIITVTMIILFEGTLALLRWTE